MLALRTSLLIVMRAGLCLAQTAKDTILLWPNGAPGAQGTADEDKPSLALYPVSGPEQNIAARGTLQIKSLFSYLG